MRRATLLAVPPVWGFPRRVASNVVWRAAELNRPPAPVSVVVGSPRQQWQADPEIDQAPAAHSPAIHPVELPSCP
jgi:hypothetical protein